jgi:hypothetical protein
VVNSHAIAKAIARISTTGKQGLLNAQNPIQATIYFLDYNLGTPLLAHIADVHTKVVAAWVLQGTLPSLDLQERLATTEELFLELAHNEVDSTDVCRLFLSDIGNSGTSLADMLQANQLTAARQAVRAYMGL